MVGKMPHQQRDILRPLAQRRHLYGKDMQAIEEIGAELLRLHHSREIAVGRGDQPRLRAQGAGAAQPLELALLQHPQQLRLHLQRQLAHLVEEEGAALGQLKAAEALRHGAGKGAFLMAEEFAFEQAGGDGGTVERHEGLRPPCAKRMDRPRQQFFASPRFAYKEHGRIGWRHELELREHRRERGAVSDDPVEAVRAVDDFAEYWSFPTSSFSYIADLVPAAFLHARRHTFPPRPWEKCLPSDGGSTSAICHTAQDSTALHVESAWQDEGTRSEHVHDRGDDEAIIAWAYDVLNGRNEVVQCRGDGGRCGERRRRNHYSLHMF